MKETYVRENAAEHERLHLMAASLSDDDLRRPLGNGMTVAVALVHLAYWDEYCLAVLRDWERTGFTPFRGNLDAANAAVRRIAAAVPERSALELALAAADAVDEHVEALAPALVTAIEDGRYARIPHRALHRRGHLDQIARAIGWGPCGR